MRLPLSNLRQSVYYKNNIFSLLPTQDVYNIDGQSNLISKRQKPSKKKTKCLLSQKQGSTIFRTGVINNDDEHNCPLTTDDLVQSRDLGIFNSSSNLTSEKSKHELESVACGLVPQGGRSQLVVYSVQRSWSESNISSSAHSFSKLPNTQIKQQARKASASLDFFKLKKIEHWIQTGNYGLQSEPEALGLSPGAHPQWVNQAQLDCSEDSEIKGHVKLTTFLTNFTSAYVIQLNVAGHNATALIDCGASKTLATSAYISECLGPQYELLLVKYEGPQFHAASGENLNIQGILHCTLQCGSLVWKEPIIVYIAAHSELLIGHSVLKTFSLLISPQALYIPIDVLKTHINTQQCCRLGTLATPILLLQCVHDHTVAPLQSISIPCFVSSQHYDKETISNLEQYSWIAHTEDMQGTTNMKEMFVFYQLIEFKQNATEVLFTNTTQEYMYFTKNEEIAHCEMMDCLAKSLIQNNGDDMIRCLYHTFQLPKPVGTIPTVSELFLHEEVDDPTLKINFETINCPSNDPEMRKFFIQFCKSLPEAFSVGKYDIGVTNDSEIIHFSVVTNATPQNCKPIPTSPALLERATDMVQNLLSRGLLTHSPPNNCWKAAMFFVLKKQSPDQQDDQGIADANPRQSQDKSKLPIRCICDYRGLNRRLRRQYPVHPLPPLRSILDKLIHKRFITAIDLRQSFWHCKLSPAAQLLTGCDFNGQHYMATRLPHGITFSSQAMQSMLCRLIRKANLEGHVHPFVDDLIVGSSTASDHKRVVTKLITTLHAAGLKINFQKSVFANQTRIVLFGWELDIQQSTIRPCLSKIAQVQSMAPPRTTKQARRFCGQFTHYNQAIPRIAAVLGPIFQLCSDRTPFKWTQECQRAFDEALLLLGKAECLVLPDFNSPFYLSADSAKGQSASFSVWQRNKQTHLLQPIRHGSFMFKKAARFYSQYKAEAMGICHGLQSSMIYFQFGTNFLITDVAAIQWLVRYRHASQQIYSWSILLCSIDLQIIAVHNKSSVISFNDAFCRPQQAKANLQKQMTYNDKKPQDLHLIDFGGLMPIPIQDMFKLIEKFQSILDAHSANKVKEKWKQMVAHSPFINRATMHLYMGTGLAIQTPNQMDWTFVSRIARIQKSGMLSHTKKADFLQVEQLLVNYFPDMALENLIYYQANDPLCKKFLSNPQEPYHIIHGVLFKYLDHKHLLVWPKSLTLPLVQAFHEFSKVYHLRHKKLLALLRQSFIVQSYRKAFDAVIANCTFCQLHSKGNHPQSVPLGMTIELKTACQMWAIDYIIINSSFKSFPAVLTVTDPLTSYTIFIPADSNWTDVQMIGALMSGCFQHLGMPQAISSDNQQSLISSRVNVWAKILGIKLFQCAFPTANPAENKHKACLAVFSMMNTEVPLIDTLMPAYCCLATLVFNSVPTKPSGKSPHYLVFNGGPFLPNVGKIAPICGLITKEQFGEFNSRFSKMKNIFHEIRKIQMGRNDKKYEAIMKYKNQINKGDLVLLIRKSVGPTRIQHKLREKCYKSPFVVKKVLQKSCVLIPFQPEKLVKHKLKRHGKIFESPELIVPFTRCKLIKNPLPFLGLNISQTNLLKLAKLFQPRPVGVCRVILTSPAGPESPLSIREFFKLFTSPGLYLSRYQKSMIEKNVSDYHQISNIRNGVQKQSLPFMNGYSIFTNENFVQLRSTVHATCTYGETSSFVRYHDKLKSVASARMLQRRRRHGWRGEDRLLNLTPSPRHSSAVYPAPSLQRSLSQHKHSPFQKYLFKRRRLLPSFVSLQYKPNIGTDCDSEYEIRVVPRPILVQDVANFLDSVHSEQSLYGSGVSQNSTRQSRNSVEANDVFLSGSSHDQTSGKSNTSDHQQSSDQIDHQNDYDDHDNQDDPDMRKNTSIIDSFNATFHDNHNQSKEQLDHHVDDETNGWMGAVPRCAGNTPLHRGEESVLRQPMGGQHRHASPPRAPHMGQNIEGRCHSDSETSYVCTSTPKLSRRPRTKSLSYKSASGHTHGKLSSSKVTLQIKHPEFLISDAHMKSSGTPSHSHVQIQMPYTSKSRDFSLKDSAKSSKKKF